MSPLRARYESFLSEAIKSGAVEKLDDRMERRSHPRLRIPFGLLRAEEMIPREMSDISLGGFAFEAIRPYQINENVAVNLRRKVGASARVVGCDPIGAQSGAHETRFRVRCQFNDEDEAILLLSLALEIDKSEAQLSARA